MCFTERLPLATAFAAISLTTTLITPAHAQLFREMDSEFREAMAGGRVWLNLRYRAEHVDQDPFLRDAFASTLRTAFGYETGSYKGFQGTIEFEDTAPIGTENYNSTTNGNVSRPVVNDLDGTEVNQVFASYDGLYEDLRLSVGRQEIVLGNARFIGNARWRQNHRTYDLIRLTYSGLERTAINYMFLHGINRPNGENHPLGRERNRSQILDVRHELSDEIEIAAYALLLDMDTSVDQTRNTYGIRVSGEKVLNEQSDLLYGLEYANQSDAGRNPGRIDATYYSAEMGVRYVDTTLRIGIEQLGNSTPGTAGFSTPLARLHQHNGYADMFTATPSAGFEDAYVSLSQRLGPVTCAAVYHEFDADTGQMDYGKELDLVTTVALSKNLTFGIKYANFNRDASAPVAFQDTEKLMGWLAYSLL